MTPNQWGRHDVNVADRSVARQRQANRILACTLIIALAGVGSAYAQDAGARKSIEIKVEDGTVWVNGERIEPGANVNARLAELGVEGVTVVVGEGDGRPSTFMLSTGDKRGHYFFDGDRPRRGYNALGAMNANDLFGSMDLSTGPGEFLSVFGSTSPEIMKKERESRELSRRIRTAASAERATLEAELDDLLGEIFDDKLQVRRDRIANLQERLEREQGDLDARVRDRSEIIARRKSELLGQQDKYDW